MNRIMLYNAGIMNGIMNGIMLVADGIKKSYITNSLFEMRKKFSF